MTGPVPSPRGCDFCSIERPAVRVYPAHSFTVALVDEHGKPIDDADGQRAPLYQSNGAWMACADCAPLVEARDVPCLLDRYAAVVGELSDHGRGFLRTWIGGFFLSRMGPSIAVADLDGCQHPVVERVENPANPEVPAGMTCMTCGTVVHPFR